MNMKKIINFKNDTGKEVIEWCNKQSNFSNAITYLIEKEVYTNGINEDIARIVPASRGKEYFTGDKKDIKKDKPENNNMGKIKIAKGYED